MRRAVFLDRDDTLIHCRDATADGDLGDPALVRLLPGAREMCERLVGAGFTLVVVSNQGGVARGRYGVEAVERVNEEVNRLLGGLVERFYFCPYHPGGSVPEFAREHPWRKPAPGMLLAAGQEMGLDLPASWMVGDTARDAQAGRAAGVRTVLVRRPGARDEAGDGGAEFVVPSLEAAADVIVNAQDAPSGSVPTSASSDSQPRPRRVLVVMPSWVGDVVMATPALRGLRDGLPGALLGALVRPGTEPLLAGTDLVDEVHIDSRAGMMGVKRAASKVRARRYECAVLLANSFSAAMAVRVAGIPRRVGYERDARSFLLTDGLTPRRRRDVEPYARDASRAREWAPVPACEYYLALVRRVLGDGAIQPGRLELATTDEEELAADEVLARVGLAPGEPFAVLNPGGNRESKRWPADRFARLAAWLRETHSLRCLVSGSPAERELTERIALDAGAEAHAVSIASAGVTIASLKAIVRRASLMVTNDTGPRHIAAAFGVPTVTLFGPTDHRWTTIPFEREAILVADPSLPEELVADDHPERCAIERITLGRVTEAVSALLG